MDMLGNLFGGSSVVDGAKLVLIGGTIETARRVGQSAWSSFLSSFYLTAHFSEEDYPFDWLNYWLEKQPAYRNSREFETHTRTSTSGRGRGSNTVDEWNEEDEEDEMTPGKQRMSVLFTPTLDAVITVYYRGHWLRVKRWKKSCGTEQLSISVVARNNAVLKKLVLEAKKLYEADAEHRVNIYFADSHGSWRWTDSRQKRPLSSIVLNKGVKEMLLADIRDFLKSEKWYADRGIPFRRGVLLHGVPGSGKTSLIHALAGELALDIYVVSLSASWINDSTLTTLMGRVPARCILLLEDLDAAFTRSSSRDGDSTGAPTGHKSTDAEREGAGHSNFSGTRHNYVPDVNTLSLSGLLNSLDGVAAAEGRILFATTNHLERLDPALSRPGRMDVWVEFRNASRWQAENLFKNFFPSLDEDAPPPPTKEQFEAMDRELAAFEARQNADSASGVGFTQRPLSPPSASGSSTLASPRNGAEAMHAATEEEKKQKYKTPDLELPPTPLDAAKLAALALEFAAAIPEEEFSIASLQGYLLKNKSRPEAAASEATEWVVSERELRAKLKREREERERKASIEREKRRKEKEEKDRKTREEEREKKRRQDREDARKEREEAARIKKEDEEYAAEEKKLAEEEAAAAKAAAAAASSTTTSADATSTTTPAATSDEAKKTEATPEAEPATTTSTPESESDVEDTTNAGSESMVFVKPSTSEDA